MTHKGSTTKTEYAQATVRIVVKTSYLPNIRTASGAFCFAYTITVHNEGQVGMRLLTRRWEITDGNGDIRTVSGDGVVGKQPHILPKHGFQYTSYVDYDTPVGYMHGTYQMKTDDGECFDAAINLFTMSAPGAFSG